MKNKDSLSYGLIMELLAPVEVNLGRTINPTLYTPQDFEAKLTRGNHFLQRVLEQPRIILWGETNPEMNVPENPVLNMKGNNA